jgi:hypothetical protein
MNRVGLSRGRMVVLFDTYLLMNWRYSANPARDLNLGLAAGWLEAGR